MFVLKLKIFVVYGAVFKNSLKKLYEIFISSCILTPLVVNSQTERKRN